VRKDAFLIPGSRDDVLATMHEVSDDVVGVAAIEPADLRARGEWSIERSERTIPAVETETWPMCRPLVEWILAHLLAGGQAWEFPEWPQQQRTALVDDLIAPRLRAAVSVADRRGGVDRREFRVARLRPRLGRSSATDSTPTGWTRSPTSSNNG